jgi:hypothetical protein
MEISNLIDILQLAVAFVQLKLDHFNKKKSSGEKVVKSKMNKYEKTMKSLDLALSETIKNIVSEERSPNLKLSRLWKTAANNLVKLESDIPGIIYMSDIAYDKSSYWLNPDWYMENFNKNEFYRISLSNVHIQVKDLRKKLLTIK